MTKSDSFKPVYLVYSASNNPDLDTYFLERKLPQIIGELADKPVFFSETSALQYSRFMEGHCIILKLYVPEAAVIGNEHKLSLKRGSVSKENVQSWGLASQPMNTYRENPKFDSQILMVGA